MSAHKTESLELVFIDKYIVFKRRKSLVCISEYKFPIGDILKIRDIKEVSVFPDPHVGSTGKSFSKLSVQLGAMTQTNNSNT